MWSLVDDSTVYVDLAKPDLIMIASILRCIQSSLNFSSRHAGAFYTEVHLAVSTEHKYQITALETPKEAILLFKLLVNDSVIYDCMNIVDNSFSNNSLLVLYKHY